MRQAISKDAIGVFDSGVGGLTVVKALRAALPDEDVVYLGDTARVPYGTKSPRTVERYALACLRFLLEQEVKLVLIACNTASATAVPALRAAAGVPLIDAVGPGARAAAAASRTGRVGVLGTLSTIRSGAYDRALSKVRPDAHVAGKACPLFVPLAEEGWTDDPVTEAVVRRYLAELEAEHRDIDTLLLGCTHYPLLASTLERVAQEIFGHGVQVVDSASTMAAAAREALAREGLARRQPQRGRLACYVTDASRLEELAPRFLGEPLDAYESIDL